MALIKFMMFVALIIVMTFHSIAPTHAFYFLGEVNEFI